jgi:hypothetical protein
MSEHYNLSLSEESKEDMDSYIDYITYTCDAPKTGTKHYYGLYNLLKNIQRNPTMFSVRTTPSLQQYGYNVRRANYKKMAILYSINGDTVYIHRIMPAKMITGL